MNSAVQNTKDGTIIQSVLKAGMGWAKVVLLAWVGMVGLSGRGEAQSEERSLRIWVDTIDFGLCRVDEGRRFEDWGVWVESSTASDTVLGFRLQDSVLACEIVVRWDVSTVRLEPPYILVPPQTLFGRFPSKVQDVDTNNGYLYVTVSADANQRPVIGTNIPLFYMKGRLVESDTTIEPPAGGAKPDLFRILEGNLGNNIGSSRFIPGFVRVLRDTTPEYTGTIRISDADLDTNRIDTVSLYVGNLADKSVREIAFSISAEGGDFRFVDTVTTGAERAEEWSGREVTIEPGRITGHFTSNVEVQSRDSLILRILLERTTDSGFDAALTIDEFSVDEFSCIGKLRVENARVVAKEIPADTADTTVSVRGSEGEQEREGIEVFQERGALRIIPGIWGPVQSVAIYDAKGARILYRDDFSSGREVLVRLEERVGEGMYFIVVRCSERIFWNRQFIQ